MDLVCQRSWPTLCNELSKWPLFQVLDLFVIWPFLGQHDVPYQRDEFWLNLEERTTSQFWVHLFENSVIENRRWINVRLCFETRNVTSNLVINHTDPLWIDAKRQVDQQWTEEPRKHLPDLWLLARVECPDNAEELLVKLRVTRRGPLRWEMSKQHGERHNSWLSPSQTWVRWSIQACHHCCYSWFGMYAEPLHLGNECATRIPKWWRIL